MRKKIVVTVAILGALFGGSSWALWRYLTTPPGDESYSRYLAIPFGIRFGEVAEMLEREKVISGVTRFRLLAKLKEVEKEIKAGDYFFHTAMTPAAVLEKLVSGEYRTHKVTIPEGYTMFQIAEVLEREGLVERGRFLACASDPEFIHSLDIKGDTVEGFLFPDTYHFKRNMGERAVISTMVDRFHEIFGEQYLERAEGLTMSREEVVTLASIVEKETADPSERYLIAAVFHNRLKRGMMLQSDPTVIYGLRNFNGNLTAEDLRMKTPFNTYLIIGLPPQPVANPGEASLRAALYPATEKYLYFVSKNDGTHHFSKTLKEHNHAVNTFQKAKARTRVPRAH